ncbi:MAG: hypothetical protein ABFR62_04695 [Bacteroidota bacterium]
MKNILSAFLLLIGISLSAEKIPAYFKSNEKFSDLNSTTEEIKANIKSSGFFVLGEYSPSDKSNQKVLTFTSNELKKFSLNFEDRGALGAVLRVSLIENKGKTTVSIANPYYMFNAYWGKSANASQKAEMKKLSNKALTIIGGNSVKFGGELSEDELAEYQYKMMMPYFTDPVELKEYSSFAEGVAKIEANLKTGKGNTKLVYKLKFSGKDIAVYGVALKGNLGESNFLPKIGEDQIAALPYEIILQGKEATMLHGKYRLALYWPELSMGQFMKIMSTPGDIEEALEAVCK